MYDVIFGSSFKGQEKFKTDETNSNLEKTWMIILEYPWKRIFYLSCMTRFLHVVIFQNLYDPSIWNSHSYYDSLARLQKEEMDKREKEKKEKTKVSANCSWQESAASLKFSYPRAIFLEWLK